MVAMVRPASSLPCLQKPARSRVINATCVLQVNPWWAAGLAVPAVILKTAFGGRGSKPKSEDVGLRV